MSILSISRFDACDAAATPIEVFTAPLTQPDPEGYNFETVLDTIAENQTQGGRRSYWSFAVWDRGHDMEAHQTSTLVGIEYDTLAVDAVRATLANLGLAYFEVPTRASREDVTMFAFPVEDGGLSYSQVTRAASLIAAEIGIKAVIPNSYFYSYFFRFRAGAIQFHEGELLSRALLDELSAEFVEMKDFIR